MTDFADVRSTADRIVDTLENSASLIRVVTNFPKFTAPELVNIALEAGFDKGAKALTTGRIDDLMTAVEGGQAIVERLVDEGASLTETLLSVTTGTNIAFVDSLGTRDPPPVGEVMLMLGGFPFMVGNIAHQSLKRNNEYRWAAQERLFAMPARQFIGPGNEKIDLEGYLLPHYTGGADTLDELRAMAGQGQPLPMIDHYGMIFGRYCIEGIDETGSELDGHGQPRRIDFHLTLSAHGEDSAGG
jgi:phage protein U